MKALDMMALDIITVIIELLAFYFKTKKTRRNRMAQWIFVLIWKC